MWVRYLFRCEMLVCIGIDDEQGNNDYLTHCCSKIPFINLIATFTDPFAAIPLLRSEKIDLVFLDFHLGSVSAPEIIAEFPSTVQVIIVSSESESMIKQYNMQITAIVNKPFPCDRLLHACQIAAKLKL